MAECIYNSDPTGLGGTIFSPLAYNGIVWGGRTRRDFRLPGCGSNSIPAPDSDSG